MAYVDAPVDCSEIFIRCHNSEDAQTILKEKKLNHLGEAQLIDGWYYINSLFFIYFLLYSTTALY